MHSYSKSLLFGVDTIPIPIPIPSSNSMPQNEVLVAVMTNSFWDVELDDAVWGVDWPRWRMR